MLRSFLEVKQSNALQVAGATPNSDRFKNILNEATSRLLRRGDSSGTVVPIRVCLQAGCVVFPRYVGTIRQAKSCCDGAVTIKNQWYDFVEREWYDCLVGECCEKSLVAYGRVPTHNTIMGDARTVRAYAQTNADYGKTITIFGTDNANQPLMHRNDDGDWVDGWVRSVKAPYAETTGYVSNIPRVWKDRRQQNVTLFAYNTTDAVLEDLALYEPGETNPSFARYKFNAPHCIQSDGTEGTRSITALVKLNFIPVEFDTDLVLIDNLTALKFMMQALLLEEGENDAAAQGKIQKAIEELNFQARDENFNQHQDREASFQLAFRLSPR